MTDQLGPALRSSLAETSLVWAFPVEPSPLIGRSMNAPLAVALSADGTSVVEAIRSDGGRLLGKRDGLVDVGAIASSLSTPGAPPARSGAAVAYARSRELLFVVGGAEPSTGEPRGDVWVHSLASGVWIPVRADGYEPRQVLAATYAFGDGRLWVLDELRQGWLRVRRLVRLDPETGEVDVVGTWPTFGLFDRHWLLVDRDGAAVLAASSKALRKHVLVRLSAEGGDAQVDGLHVGQWDLVGAPAIDAKGVWLVRHPSKKHGARVLRLDGIGRVPASWDEVRSCLR